MHGIILQTPLPRWVDGVEVAGDIAFEKDVDGANPLSLGRLAAGLPAFAPATAAAVMRLLDDHGVALSGRRVVVVGRSLVVGKPVAMLLLARDATVTVCHSRTADLAGPHGGGGRPGRGRRPGRGLLGAEPRRARRGRHRRRDEPDENGGLIGDVDTAAGGRPGGRRHAGRPEASGPVTTARLLLQGTVTAAGRAAD